MTEGKSAPVREVVVPRYDLIPLELLNRIALIYAEGAQRYGDRTWIKGQPFSVPLNHIFEHLRRYQQGDRGEDHLAKVAWGVLSLMYYETHHPEMDDWTERMML